MGVQISQFYDNIAFIHKNKLEEINMNKTGILLAIVVGAFILGRVYYRATDDFRIGNMTHDVSNRPEWEAAPLNSEEMTHVKKILDQPYHYLGKGAQSYAFLSADGDYVLKFFKFKHLRQAGWVSYVPSIPPFTKWKEEDREKKESKLISVFDGYLTAYNLHREESGILYLHFNKTTNQLGSVKVSDKLGIGRTIDLDRVMFILQSKVKPMRGEIIQLINRGDVAGAIAMINKTFDLYMSEYRKGIYDRDHGVMHNTGYITLNDGTVRAVHLDVGKMSKEPKMKEVAYFAPDLEKVARKIDAWMALNYPKYYPEVSKAMEERLTKEFNKPFSFKDAPASAP
jgi:hypothetical protein